MMKYIYRLFFLGLVTIQFGCSDFLEIDNPSAVTDDFYNTKTGQEKLLVDIYSKCRNLFNTGELQYYGTDLYMAITESPNERMFNGYDESFNSTAGVVGGYWANLYKIVQESNILLNRCDLSVEGMTQAEFESLTAQTRFLRAQAYYYLVETFGPVPLLSLEAEDIIMEVTRNSEEEIYDFMIDELLSVQTLLPWRSDIPGTISKGAVCNLLGKLYLTRAYKPFKQDSDFEEAAKYLDQVIFESDNKYALLESYADVFDENNQNNTEVIWAIQYGTDKEYAGGGNPQQALFGINLTALEPDLFIREQEDYSSMQRLYWIIPEVHELFTDPDMDARYDATFKREIYVNNPESEYFGQLGIYYPKWNDESGDDKGAVNFLPYRMDGEYGWYPQSTALEILQMGTDRMPLINKFKDTQMQWGGPGSREDVVFRLGDTYLLAAEAYLGAGEAGTALERLNAVRRRAAIDVSMQPGMELDAISMDVILDERARELLGEHDRWFDLKRTGKLIERAYLHNIFVQKYNNLNVNHLLRPIPQDEINKLKGLTQNEGY
jgi:starch-binding outer membrane protein, SusD/RagB family